ncbi:MAG: conjugal transfer protein TraX [Clostridiales bacterium]|nr:conjugal transfer protein TraX [Clostridiales bacterium]
MSSFALRAIALVCMMADHIGLSAFPGANAFRCVGRVAFPLYCFLLVQGYRHTRDVRAYARRLLLLALISEIPFDWLIFGRITCLSEQNALFSLLLALTALAADDALRDQAALRAMALGGLCVAAMLSRVSFGWLGVALCLCFYELGGLRRIACAAALLLVYTMSLAFSGVAQGWAFTSLWALLALPLIVLYNGRPGPRPRLLTALFYAAYPLHLIALAVVRALRIVPPYFF